MSMSGSGRSPAAHRDGRCPHKSPPTSYAPSALNNILGDKHLRAEALLQAERITFGMWRLASVAFVD